LHCSQFLAKFASAFPLEGNCALPHKIRLLAKFPCLRISGRAYLVAPNSKSTALQIMNASGNVVMPRNSHISDNQKNPDHCVIKCDKRDYKVTPDSPQRLQSFIRRQDDESP
jgi:hypothetical protein